MESPNNAALLKLAGQTKTQHALYYLQTYQPLKAIFLQNVEVDKHKSLQDDWIRGKFPPFSHFHSINVLASPVTCLLGQIKKTASPQHF